MAAHIPKQAPDLPGCVQHWRGMKGKLLHKWGKTCHLRFWSCEWLKDNSPSDTILWSLLPPKLAFPEAATHLPWELKPSDMIHCICFMLQYILGICLWCMLHAYYFFKHEISKVYVHIYKQLITTYSSSTPVFSSVYFCHCTVPADPSAEFKSKGRD